jgi:hypothetical protein
MATTTNNSGWAVLELRPVYLYVDTYHPPAALACRPGSYCIHCEILKILRDDALPSGACERYPTEHSKHERWCPCWECRDCGCRETSPWRLPAFDLILSRPAAEPTPPQFMREVLHSICFGTESSTVAPLSLGSYCYGTARLGWSCERRSKPRREVVIVEADDLLDYAFQNGHIQGYRLFARGLRGELGFSAGAPQH